METSEQVNELAAALAKAQGEIKGAVKDAQNPFYKSKYATLDAVWEACRAALSANGIAVIQAPTTPHEATVCVTTMLLHASGQWVREALTLSAGDGTPQETGSALTYARRYGLSAMVGVAPEDDDDANAAQGQKMPPRPAVSKWAGRTEPKVIKGGLPMDGPAIDAEEQKIFGAKPVEGPMAQIPDELANDRFQMEMSIARLSEKHKFSKEEKLALSIMFLNKSKVVDAKPIDLVKLYLFLNDSAAVASWRQEQEDRR